MPAKPQPLRPIEPKRPPEIPEGLWSFPRNLADEANARGWSQEQLAEKIGVAQSTVSRWMHYDIDGLKVRDVLRIERAMELGHGELTLPTTVLRARHRNVDVKVHDSLPPAAADKVRRLAGELAGKHVAQPRRGARAKRD